MYVRMYVIKMQTLGPDGLELQTPEILREEKRIQIWGKQRNLIDSVASCPKHINLN